GLWRYVADRGGTGINPALQDRVVGADDFSGTGQQPGAPDWLEGKPREPIAQRAWSDSRVVVDAPEGCDGLWRSGGPSDSQAGQAIRLGQTGRADDLGASPPHGCRFLSVSFGAPINLV